MKKVIFNKRKFTLKDFWRIVVLLFIHATGFLLYFLLVLGFNFIYKQTFIPTQLQWDLLLIYPLTIGIVINVAFHIIYTEMGNSWIRLMMWIHTALIASLISVFIFIF